MNKRNHLQRLACICQWKIKKKSWYKWYLDTGYIQYIFYENDQFEGLMLVEIANLEYIKGIDDRT